MAHQIKRARLLKAWAIRDELIDLFEEPILAGNTLVVGLNEVYSGEQEKSLVGISRLTTTSHMPSGALLYGGYAFLVLRAHSSRTEDGGR